MQQKAYNTTASLVEAANLISAGADTHAGGLGLVVATKVLVDADVLGVTNTSASLLQGKHDLRGLRNVYNLKQKDAYDIAFVVRIRLNVRSVAVTTCSGKGRGSPTRSAFRNRWVAWKR